MGAAMEVKSRGRGWKSTRRTLTSADLVRQHVISGIAGILRIGLQWYALSTPHTLVIVHGGIQMLPAAFKRLATHTQNL